MCRCFEYGRYGEEGQHHHQVRPDEQTLGDTRVGIAPEIQFERNDADAGHSFSPAAMRDACQPIKRQHDERDHREDEVGLTHVRALEAGGSHHLADPKRGRNTREHRDREHVDESHEPALRAEPRERPVAVDRGDHRHHDRGEQDEEPPEDRCVHRPGQQPLEQLALPEHDHGFVANAPRNVVVALDGLPRADEAGEQKRAPPEERARDGERRRERERAGERCYSVAPS